MGLSPVETPGPGDARFRGASPWHSSCTSGGRSILEIRAQEVRVMSNSVLGLLASVAIVGALVSPGHGYEPVTVANGGAVEGKIEFTGPKPPARQVIPTKDKEVCGGVREVEQIRLSPDKGVADAVVWVKGVEKGKGWDKAPAPPALKNTNCDFAPFVQVVPAGADVELVNNDAVFHNLHSFLGKATVHNVNLPKNGRPIRRPFKESGMVRVECDSHSWMKAWIYVADSPYYAMTGPDGRFAIRDLPPGSYTLVAWHDFAGLSEVPIQVGPGATVPLNVTLSKPPATR
jgi:plastocyanin